MRFRRSVILLTGLGIILLIGMIRFLDPNRSSGSELSVETIYDDLHVIGGGGGNVGVLVTEEGVVLVDDMFERHVGDILAAVKTLTDRPVRYVFNTHVHGDHSDGNRALIDSSEIIAHHNVRKLMEERSRQGKPRLTFQEETSVFLGGKEVRAYHAGRGHTNGDVVVFFPHRQVVHMGDLFVPGLPLIDYGSGGSGIEWLNTLDTVLEMEFERVIPGHGGVARREDLVRWAQSFRTLRDRLDLLRQQGAGPEEAMRLIRTDDLPGWEKTKEFRVRMAAFYRELSRSAAETSGDPR